MSPEISVRPIISISAHLATDRSSHFFLFFFLPMFDERNFIFRFHTSDSIGYNRIRKKKYS